MASAVLVADNERDGFSARAAAAAAGGAVAKDRAAAEKAPGTANEGDSGDGGTNDGRGTRPERDGLKPRRTRDQSTTA